LRFGIRGPSYAREVDLADYVLSDFEPEESAIVEEAVARSRDALLMFVRGDLRRAMNTFNRDPEPETKADDPTPTNAR
jgi:peptidyl-tRNA hydrolase